MTKAQFKSRWEVNKDHGGLTYDEIAECAVAWGISPRPKIRSIDLIMELVLQAAGIVERSSHD